MMLLFLPYCCCARSGTRFVSTLIVVAETTFQLIVVSITNTVVVIAIGRRISNRWPINCCWQRIGQQHAVHIIAFGTGAGRGVGICVRIRVGVVVVGIIVFIVESAA